MKRQTRSEQIQNAIDTTLSGLKDDPRLAQRVIRAARQTETPKRKRFYGMVLAALLLLLAATAVAAAYLSAQQFVQQEVLPLAQENDADGYEEKFSNQELAEIVRLARENGIALSDEMMAAFENGYGYYCLLADGEREPERILLSTPDSPTVPKLTYLAGSLEAYANALTQRVTVQDGVIGADVAVAVQTPLISPDGKPVSLVLAKLSWQQEDRVLSEEILNLQEGETEGSLTGQFSLRLEAPPMEDGAAIDLVLTAELSDGRVLTAVAGSWTALDGQLDSSVG